jgi:hypothetical protein
LVSTASAVVYCAVLCLNVVVILFTLLPSFRTVCFDFIISLISSFLFLYFLDIHLIYLLLYYHFPSFLSLSIGALPAVRVDSDIDGNGASISKLKASKHQKAGAAFLG